MVSSNHCVGPSPRANISFSFLTVCNDELSSTPKIIAFLLQSKPGYEKNEPESNPILYSEQEYLSGSGFLVNF